MGTNVQVPGIVFRVCAAITVNLRNIVPRVEGDDISVLSAIVRILVQFGYGIPHAFVTITGVILNDGIQDLLEFR